MSEGEKTAWLKLRLRRRDREMIAGNELLGVVRKQVSMIGTQNRARHGITLGESWVVQ